jgi:hypothetical protein
VTYRNFLITILQTAIDPGVRQYKPRWAVYERSSGGNAVITYRFGQK